ncbi:RusA family crossover junction endodeoxyribonuclease [Actinomycetospora soli]|uniref:RusA family crossover junction endodeoxyribonuclease n=1 Tax=Actinomycetospora soli TaxID=2893887 RepID=UPI001E63E9CF|nr:RusA family crossover junction endodeoxyribonuclease [Actinomycetospora soli]MCD2191584.1 RusA family crossover junction endodeoxyribonuclease [Actinomycetospora soli]
MSKKEEAAPFIQYAQRCAYEHKSPEVDVWEGLLAEGFLNDTGTALATPLSAGSRETLRLWLQGLRVDDPFGLDLSVKRPTLAQCLFLTIGEKASHLAQTACMQCSLDDDPIAATLPIAVEPISAQSSNSDLRGLYKRRIQDALRTHRNEDGTSMFARRGLCVTVVNVLGAKVRKKDADNLVKALLDDMQGILYDNDNAIVHLQSFRLGYDGDASYHHVHLTGVRADSAEDEKKQVLDIKKESTLLSGHPTI